MKTYSLRKRLMGSDFELIVMEESPSRADLLLKMAVNEIVRIEMLLSEFLPDSQTSLINIHAGEMPVLVNKEVADLISRCLKLSEITQGAFDISVGALKKLYKFNKEVADIPECQKIENTLQYCGHRKISLHGQHVSFENKFLRISFAAVGKGYAADRVKQIWLEQGLKSGVINASGDMTVFGSSGRQEGWRVGIADPDDTTRVQMYLNLHNCSIATSGDYHQYFINNGIRYSHNINPVTGLPLKGIKSVSIINPSAELCDALSTAVYAMGTVAGLYLVNQMPDTRCIIIDEENKLHCSDNLKPEYEMV